MNRLATTMTVLFWVSTLASSARATEKDEATLRNLTRSFCESIVAKDLSVIDRLFDPSPENIFYDINEGPLTFERLKRVWRAATTNYTISRFEFGDDLKIKLRDDEALETGTWEQTQVRQDGTSREIMGRATILWKKTPEGWKVYHYHASVTPPRRQRRR